MGIDIVFGDAGLHKCFPSKSVIWKHFSLLRASVTLCTPIRKGVSLVRESFYARVCTTSVNWWYHLFLLRSNKPLVVSITQSTAARVPRSAPANR